MKPYSEIGGALVEIPLGPKLRPLVGFWSHGSRRAPSLLIFVHGMHSNFYRSPLKKEFLARGPRAGIDVLSFNNSGAEGDVETERFRDCLRDIDAAIAWGRARGYRRFALIGHSTGCQKIAYWQHVRKDRQVRALVLAAIGDDYAIFRRDLGTTFFQRLEKARQWISNDWESRRLPADCNHFTAARFLSVADTRQVEARLFNFAGPMREFARIRTPVLALFPEEEENACIPVAEMESILKRKTRARVFRSIIIPGAPHNFRGAERAAVRATLDWLQGVMP